MVVIRLARHGAKKTPVYRVVAADARSRRDGRFIVILGTFHATGSQTGCNLKLDRVDYWLGQGAQTSDTAKRLIRDARKAAEAADAAE